MTITYTHGPKQRTWGGWYQHTQVFLDGVHIGTIQTRRKNKRTDVMTSTATHGVIGYDLQWLIRIATQQQTKPNREES